MQSRVQQLALVLALVAAAGLLVPTGAIAFLPEQPTDQIDEQVAIQPTDSGYAYLEDDELVIDLSSSNPNIEAGGLNPDAEFTFDDLFVIHYDGDQYAEVWLTHDGEGVNFTSGGTSIESRENNVTLGPNESVTVGMTVNTSDPQDIESIDEFTVHSRVADTPEATTAGGGVWTVTSATVTVTTPAPGERIVSIEDASAGDSLEADLDALALDDTDDGTLTADTMTVDHEQAGDSEFELAAVNETDPAVADFTAETGMKALGAVSVTPIEDDAVESIGLDLRASADYLATQNTAGEDVVVYRYDGETWHALDAQHTSTDDGSEFAVAVQDLSTFVVGAPTAFFDVTAVHVNESEVTAGDTVSILGTVTNRGTANGTTTVPFTVDDETVDQQTRTLAPNETTTVTFTQQFQESGNYTLAIGDAPGVQVEVTAAIDGTVSGEGTTETITPMNTTTQTTEPTEEPATSTLVEEPASIDLERILGLGLVATLILLTVLLVRRRPLE